MSDALQSLVQEHIGLFTERQLRLLELVGDRPATFDADRGVVTYGDDLSFKAQLLATEVDGRWKWSWSDSRLPADLQKSAKVVQSRGIQHDVGELLDAELPLDGLDVLGLAAVSVGAVGADGYVAANGEAGRVHCLIKDLEFPRQPADAKRLVFVFERAVQERRVASQRQTLLAYLAQSHVTHHIEDDEVIGLTVDGQLIRASFDGEERLRRAEVQTEPPDGFPLDRLEWREKDGLTTLTLTSVDVGVLGRLLSTRSSTGQPFNLKGPRGRVLQVQPGPASFRAEEQAFTLQLDPADEAALRAVLRPGCGEYRCQVLPGLIINVTEFEVLDAAGSPLRTVGWEPLPEPSWAIDPAEVTAAAEHRASRRGRRKKYLACGLLALLFGFWPGLFAFGTFHLRHVPATLPERYAPPPASGLPMATGTGLSLRYLGISGYEITDGTTVILLDPVLTRPTLTELFSGPIEPDPDLLTEFRRADYILINHAHHDHALDMPALAERTGATVVGSQSAVNLALSRGIPQERTRLAVPGERLRLGTFVVDVRGTSHSPILGVEDPMAGTIPADAGELWFNEYTNDGTRTYRLEANGTSVWWHVSMTPNPGAMDLPAGTLIMGIAGKPATPELVRQFLAEAQPHRVLPTHYDNFFQPRELGMAILPTIDLEATCATIQAEAGPDVPVFLLDFDQAIDLPAD